MNEKAFQAIYNDLKFESKGVSYDKFKEVMSNNEEARKRVYTDAGFEKSGVSYDKFVNVLGLSSGGGSMGKLKALKRAWLKKLLQWIISKCNNLLQKL